MRNETVWVHTAECVEITAHEMFGEAPRIEYRIGDRVIGSHAAHKGDMERIECTAVLAEARKIGALARVGAEGMAAVLFALIPPPGLTSEDLGIETWSATGKFIDSKIAPHFSNLRPVRHLLGMFDVDPDLLPDTSDPLRTASAMLSIHLFGEDRPSAEERAIATLIGG